MAGWILVFNNVRFTLEIPGITALDLNSRGLLPLRKTRPKFVFLSNTKTDAGTSRAVAKIYSSIYFYLFLLPSIDKTLECCYCSWLKFKLLN